MATDKAPVQTLQFAHRANIGRFRELLSRSDDEDLRAQFRAQIAREEYELHLLSDPSNAVSADARFRLAAIAESSDDAIVDKDLNGSVTAWNKAAESMFGYKAEEIVGQPLTITIPPHRIDEEASILDRVRRGERIVHFETERQRKDGGIIWVSLTVSPIRDDEGRIIGVSKIARDLTKRQEGERRINELQAELVHVTRVTELGQMVSALAPPMQTAAPECIRHEVHFASGSALMDAEDIKTINAVTLAAAPPNARVILVGKTDTVGSKAANMALSKRRADNVNKALIDNGVLASHIAWFFTGDEKPVVATADQEDEPLNRVVKIAVGVNCSLPK